MSVTPAGTGGGGAVPVELPQGFSMVFEYICSEGYKTINILLNVTKPDRNKEDIMGFNVQ